MTLLLSSLVKWSGNMGMVHILFELIKLRCYKKKNKVNVTYFTNEIMDILL